MNTNSGEFSKGFTEQSISYSLAVVLHKNSFYSTHKSQI